MHRHRLTTVALALAVGVAVAASPTVSHAQPAPPDAPMRDERVDGPDDVATRGPGRLPRTAIAPTEGLFVIDREPVGADGRNDDVATAQHLRRLGTSAGQVDDALIVGTIADVRPAVGIGPFAEDDGAFPLANPTGLTLDRPSVRVSGTIGDGPHGTIEGDGRGDFDFYVVEAAVAGQVLTVDVDARDIGSALDPIVAVSDTIGNTIAINDDGPGADSFVRVAIPADGDYVIGLAASGSLPADPFDSGSGPGALTEGAYELTMSYDATADADVDVDVYRVDLRAGDVVGASVVDGARMLEVLDPSGALAIGSDVDQSGYYPTASPLRIAGNATLDHVAAVDGPHYVRVAQGSGRYRVDLRVRRPGLETAAAGERQILFLDFDGAEIDPSTFGTNSGTLSPLAEFLAGWRLGPDDESALIDSILATFAENVEADVAERGGNPRFAVEIRNSRDHADPWGQPNVSRVVIGGTRQQLGTNTVGLAQSIDPGNFDREETGVVLLDQASAPAGSGLRTINDAARPDTDMVALVGRALGFIASHEAAHYLGNWHTRPNNGVVSIMDTVDPTQLGLGPDFIFGTADDVDVDFVTDEIIEGRTGHEDTTTRMAFALSSRG